MNTLNKQEVTLNPVVSKPLSNRNTNSPGPRTVSNRTLQTLRLGQNTNANNKRAVKNLINRRIQVQLNRLDGGLAIKVVAMVGSKLSSRVVIILMRNSNNSMVVEGMAKVGTDNSRRIVRTIHMRIKQQNSNSSMVAGVLEVAAGDIKEGKVSFIINDSKIRTKSRVIMPRL